MSAQLLTIKILSWEKHNPKRDQKTYTWLRLNNDIANDPDLFGLTAEQKFVFIEILCQASKRNTGKITINLGQLSHVTGVSRSAILELIEHLKQKPMISVYDNARSHDVAATTPTYVRTYEEYVHVEPGLFDEDPKPGEGNACEGESNPTLTKKEILAKLDEIYTKYPRKEGKSEGYDRLVKILKTAQDCVDFETAVTNYAKAKQGTEKKHLRMFSSFVGTMETQSWRDWIAPDSSVFHSGPGTPGTAKAMRKVGENVHQ